MISDPFKAGCRGFGLVEAIVAAAIFSFAVVASLTALKVALKNLDEALIVTDGQVKAQTAMEEAVSSPDRAIVFSDLSISKDTGGDTELKQKLKKRVFDSGRRGNAKVEFKAEPNPPSDFSGLSISLQSSSGNVEAYQRYFYED